MSTKSKAHTAANVNTKPHSFVVGESYFLRSVTHYFLGRLKSITDTDMILEDASWVADTGRYSNFLKSGNANELEPYPGDAIVFRGCLVDGCVWNHKLPRDQK